MGLTTFLGSQPTFKDALIAKNYLDEKELRSICFRLPRFCRVSGQVMTMQDWAEHLDRLLTMNGEKLLIGNGSISHKEAEETNTENIRRVR